MPSSHAHRIEWSIGALVLATVVLAGWKLYALGYSLADTLPLRRHVVTYELTLDGQGGDVRVRTFLPLSDPRQSISDEQNASPGLHFSSETGPRDWASCGAWAREPDIQWEREQT